MALTRIEPNANLSAAENAVRSFGLYTDSLVAFLSSASLEGAFTDLVALMASSFPQAAPVVYVCSDETGCRSYGAIDELAARREAERALGRRAKLAHFPVLLDSRPRALNDRFDLNVLSQGRDQVRLSVNHGYHDEFFGEWVKILAPGVSQRLAAEQLKRMAYRDGLTGLYNRRAWDEMLALEIERARRHGTALAAIMFDVDRFKIINDKRGHQVGDQILIEIAAVINECCRKIDLPFRLGGDEFALLLPQTDIQAACRLAERLRRGVAEKAWGEGMKVSVSVGVSQYDAGGSAERMVRQADQGLYLAKACGGNQVEIVKGVQ